MTGTRIEDGTRPYWEWPPGRVERSVNFRSQIALLYLFGGAVLIAGCWAATVR